MPTLFLAVPGTQQTREVDLEAVRQGVARGEIQLDNWAWSAQCGEWMPLAQVPEFNAAVPAFAAAQPVPVEPKKVEPAPRAQVAVRAQAQPATVATSPTRHAATYYSKPIEEAREFPVFRTLILLLGLAIAVLVVVNYVLIDKPFREKMALTPFAGVQAHAHLGAFVQPQILFIHILPSREINAANFADLLAALARSAPRLALPGYRFQAVSLTSAWQAQYVISMDDWIGVSEIENDPPAAKRQYILSHLQFSGGAPLVENRRRESAAQHEAAVEDAWHILVARFQRG